MKITEATVAWTPANSNDFYAATRGKITLAGKPPHEAVDAYQCWLYADGGSRAETQTEQLLYLFTLFNTCVVRDGIDPQAVHDAFLGLDEYRYQIARDMRGAQDPPGFGNNAD